LFWVMYGAHDFETDADGAWMACLSVRIFIF
jgi:hypothetical protein